MKKKILSVIAGLLMVGILAGCIPDGFSETFYYDAKNMFVEIDDDTSEIENPDADDVMNLDLLESYVITKKDEAVYEKLQKLLELNYKMLGEVDEDEWDKSDVRVNREALKEYIKVRRQIAEILEISMYKFQFQED